MDGFARALVVGEDFSVPHSLVFAGWEELEEPDDLQPYESSPVEGVWQEGTRAEFGKGTPPTERQAAEMAWGALCSTANDLAYILGGRMTSAQHNHYSPDGRDLERTSFTFQYEAGDTGWSGARL